MVAENAIARHAQRKREAPWYGVGEKGEWYSIEDALCDSDLMFNVSPHRASVETLCPTKGFFKAQVVSKQEVPGIMVNMRDDTDEIVGVVSDRYGIVQNKDAFMLMEPFVKNGAVITNAGMTQQGMCFMIAKMTSTTVIGDEFEFYVCMTNSFNSKFPLSLFISPLRVICQNMFPKLMAGGNAGMIHIKHGCNSYNRLDAAYDASDVASKVVSSFSDQCDGAFHKKLDPAKCVSMLFPYPGPGYKGDVGYAKEKADAMREMFMGEYYHAPDNSRYLGTSLGFVNAYFDYLSHRPEMRTGGGSWEDRRLSGLMSGKDVSNKILKEAMA